MKAKVKNHYTPIFKNLLEVIENKSIRNNTPFVYKKNGEGFYLVNGEEVPAIIFNVTYPVDLIKSANQIDGRTNFY